MAGDSKWILPWVYFATILLNFELGGTCYIHFMRMRAQMILIFFLRPRDIFLTNQKSLRFRIYSTNSISYFFVYNPTDISFSLVDFLRIISNFKSISPEKYTVKHLCNRNNKSVTQKHCGSDTSL